MAWAAAIAFFLAGLITLTGEHRWGDDWAQYVLHARNLVTGLPYPDTGYVFNPEVAYLGPPSYPPGLPLLLAPFIAIFGLNIAALKSVGLLCLAMALPACFRLAAPVVGGASAAVAVVLLALHPAYWQTRQSIESEAPYLLFSMLALWFCARPVEAGRNRELRAALILGALIYAGLICRTVGIALLPAVLVWGWAQRKPFAWFAGTLVSLALLLLLQTLWLVAPPTYSGEVTTPALVDTGLKLRALLGTMGRLFAMPFGLAPVAAALVALTAICGAWFACTQPASGQGGNHTFRGLAARVPLFVWYLGSYLSALLIATVELDVRLLVPILPILIVLAVYGVLGMARRRRVPRSWLAALGLASAAYLVAVHASGRYSPIEQAATCAECVQMFTYVREHAAPGEIVVFNKPRAMALFAGRPSWGASLHYSAEELEQRLARLGATLVVVGLPGTEFSRRYPTPPAVSARVARSDVEIVFRNAAFLVVRLGSPRPPP